ncbi:hypothetical protein PIB30_043160 [Stylosanthes scabra]|uniref:Uncharacterized protein n=1 Tax=Stylosanthes scabra TaxID=79078 RepID=A0ABU6RG60_9FABA|nr:hypothetical protein [Stylosanthes scabra]
MVEPTPIATTNTVPATLQPVRALRLRQQPCSPSPTTVFYSPSPTPFSPPSSSPFTSQLNRTNPAPISLYPEYSRLLSSRRNRSFFTPQFRYTAKSIHRYSSPAHHQIGRRPDPKFHPSSRSDLRRLLPSSSCGSPSTSSRSPTPTTALPIHRLPINPKPSYSLGLDL